MVTKPNRLRPLAQHDHFSGLKQGQHIEIDAEVFYAVQVLQQFLHCTLVNAIVGQAYWGTASQPGFDAVTLRIERDILHSAFNELGALRQRPDKAHIALLDIEQQRQLKNRSVPNVAPTSTEADEIKAAQA